MMMKASRSRLAFVIATCAALAAACGDDATDDGGAGSGTIPPSDAATGGDGGEGGGGEHVITASNAEEFDVDALEVPAGEVTVTFDNQHEGVPHNVHFLLGTEDEPATEIVNGPEAADVTITAEPGEYEYLCDVHPNMTGTLTVTE